MRCWQCGAVPNIATPEDEAVRVICTCGKDLGMLHPKPKPIAPAIRPVVAAPAPAVDLSHADPEDNRRVIHSGGYGAGIGLSLFGIVFLIGAGYYFLQADNALATMKIADGRVTNVQRGDGGRARSVDATVTFQTTEGKTFEARFVMRTSTKLGEQVRVLYDPNEPTVNRQGSTNALYGFTWAGAGLGLVILLVGMYSIFSQSVDNEKFRDEMAAEEDRHGSPFPAVCAGCAQGAPVGTWRVCGPTKTVDGPAAVVHTTPFVEVPICRKCLWTFYAVYGLIGLVGISVGLGVFAAIFFQEGDTKGLIAWAILGGGFAGLITVCIGQFCTQSVVSLGDFDPETNNVHFKNGAYQTLYFQHVVKVTSGATKAAGSLEAILGR